MGDARGNDCRQDEDVIQPPIPLMWAKLRPPVLATNTVARERVVDELSSASAALTAIVAPAGYGKTTAAAQVAERVGDPVAWVALEPADSDPARFWTYVAAASPPLAWLEQMARMPRSPVGRRASTKPHWCCEPQWNGMRSRSRWCSMTCTSSTAMRSCKDSATGCGILRRTCGSSVPHGAIWRCPSGGSGARGNLLRLGWRISHSTVPKPTASCERPSASRH